METENAVLRIEIDRDWSAEEFATSIQSVAFLYNLRLYLDYIDDVQPYWDEFYHFLPPFRRSARPRSLPYGIPFGTFLYRSEDLRQFTRIYFPELNLSIGKIQFASPGFKDFRGALGSFKKLYEYLKSLLLVHERKEAARLANEGQQIENTRNFVRLRVETAIANEVIDRIEADGLAGIADENVKELIRLMQEGKITGVKLNPSANESEPRRKRSKGE